MKLQKERIKQVSFRRIVLLIMSAIAIPLFAVILLFEWNTAKTHQTNVNTAYRSTLSAYQITVEDTLDMVSKYIIDAAANNTNFQMLAYAKNKTEAYLASVEVESQYKPLLQAHELIGGFYIYSADFHYYHTINTVNYPHQDLQTIQAAVYRAAVSDEEMAKWIPLALSDRIVFLYTFTNRGNAISAMVDPARQTHSGLEQGGKIFFASADGTPMAPETAFGDSVFPTPENWNRIYRNQTEGEYGLIYLPLQQIPGYIVYAVPYRTFFEQLSILQRFLMIMTLSLLISIPVCWLLLRNLLLRPLTSLTKTTRAIKSGNTGTRVPMDSHVYEVNAIAETVNTMLDTIQQQKIEAYEKELAIFDLQLQYLQLQLRPHFFLNCLNMVYSLAEEKDYAALQEITLNLSDYLRNVFKDSSRMVTLAAEIRSVESYIRILGIGTSFPPKLDIIMDSDTSELMVPPICILLFVENSVKHADTDDGFLKIRIKCGALHSDEGGYLNITISDNGGGFSAEKLEELNSFSSRLASEGHIGIANVRRRLHYIYGSEATISFQNRSGGACVELFIPLETENIHAGGAFS